MGALVVLGLILIVRGPRGPAPSTTSDAQVTGADVSSPSGSASPVEEAADAEAGPHAPAPRPPPVWRVSAYKLDASIELLEGTLGKRTLGGAFQHAGLSRLEARRVARVFEGIRRVEHGASKDAFVIARDRSKGAVVAVEYVASPTDVWQAKADDGSSLVVKKLELFVESKLVSAALAVSADLSKAVAASKLREEALENIDDALDGHVDLATIKPGARLRVVGNEEWVEGAFARFHVEALEYVPREGEAMRIYFYERDASSAGNPRRAPRAGFYDGKGRQPYRGTFRSPLPFARVTSRFNPKRMHPVLHVVMPHNGVDFGAASGTPVFASAAGTLQSAGDGGPCGNMVKIEHAGGLTTAYCHLSRFAPGLRSGQHVEARQLVGYVGQTGRATGPHLHFAVLRGQTFIDPLGIKMDGVRTLPPVDREPFAKKKTELDAALDAISMPAPSTSPADDDDKDEPAGEE
ncbi:MAG: M23 family metallopeptidase [Labilithrix sp.]|nr:M23 family metallopeptidase [Labilithrix sp.]